MSADIVVPQLGESVTEATVAKWFKQPGESVEADEPVVELETDKVTVEVNAPEAGTLAEIVADEGSDVEVGALLGRLGEAGAAKPSSGKPAQDTEKKAGSGGAPSAAPDNGSEGGSGDGPSDGDAPAMSPAARKMIEENDLDPAAIDGTGKGGSITKEDVVNHLDAGVSRPAQQVPSKAPPPASRPSVPRRETGPREERVRMTRLRQKIAERLKDAQNEAAMLTTFNEVDMTGMMALRDRYKAPFEKKYGVKLGFMGFFVKAVVAALKDWPAVNAEIDGTDIVYKNYFDIGVAVGTDQGLVVPVVRDCDAKSFAEIESDILDLAKKARDGKLGLDDLSGGTFSITNGGIYGNLMSTPILNPPQSGILGMHKTQMRPMVMPDGAIEARPMMYIALSYDHRIIDGREAVSFLVRVKEGVEDPARLLLEV